MATHLRIAKFLLLTFVVLWVAPAVQAQESPLPPPTGPFAVGRTLFDWTDQSRVDLENANGHREIMVWLWYPASPAPDAKKAEWLPGIWGDIFASSPDLAPKPSESNGPPPPKYPIHNLRANSFEDAPVLSGSQRFPVLLFAPGYGSSPTDYSSLIEDAASHGYIVAGIVPTYFSSYTVFADGRVAGQHPLPREIPGAPRSSWGGATNPVPEPVYQLWVGDLRFALDRLVALNADDKSPFKGRLDLDRVGAMGHSIGATAIAQVAQDDSRVKAVVLIEGALMGDVARNPTLSKPLLVLLASSAKGRLRVTLPNLGTSNELVKLVSQNRPSYVAIIDDTSHPFPADVGLMPFAKDWRHDPNPMRALAATKAYVEDFFDSSLGDKASALLNGPSSTYPFVTLQRTLEQTPVDVFASAGNVPAAIDISGTWHFTINRPDENGGPIAVTFSFKQDKGKLSGTYSGFGQFGEEQINGAVSGSNAIFGWQLKGPGGAGFPVVFKGSAGSPGKMSGPVGSPFCGLGCSWEANRK